MNEFLYAAPLHGLMSSDNKHCLIYTLVPENFSGLFTKCQKRAFLRLLAG